MIKLKSKPESTVTSAGPLIIASNTSTNNNTSHEGQTSLEMNRPVNGLCDLSLLRKPIDTTVTSFQEARKAFEHGTEEIQKLLANECDIIYECKVCRNIFRSLANFISHKRCYCKTEFNKTQHFHFRSNGFIDHDVATIIQAEQDFAQTYSHKLKRPDDVNKDLSSIVERLRRKQHTDDDDLTEYYDQIHAKVTHDQSVKKKNHVIQLDRVPESSAAVYQTIGRSGRRDNIKDEVTELHGILANKHTILGPDGGSADHNMPTTSNHSFNNEDSSQSSGLQDDELACKVCGVRFQTEKTLKLHVEKKHLPSTQVYPCPSCNETFLQPSAVIRHLSNDHKKSMRRIRTMRDAIYKKSSRADEVVVKGPSRELSRLRQSTLVSSANSNYGDDNGVDEQQQKKAYIENMENYKNMPYCTYCGKNFDRKAVLQSHIQGCRKKHRKQQAAAAAASSKAASPITVDLDRVKIEQRSDTPDSMKTTNSADSMVATMNGGLVAGYHLAEIKQSNLHYNLTEHELSVGANGADTSESCSVKSAVLEAEEERRNKRKRKCAVKIVNEEEPTTTKIEEGDEFYWVVEETDGVSLKKLKTEEQELIFSDLTGGGRPPSTVTTYDDEEDLPFVSASEVEKEVEEAAAAVAAAALGSMPTFPAEVAVVVKTEIPDPVPDLSEPQQQPQPQTSTGRKRSRPPVTKKSTKEADALKTIPCKLCPKLFATKRNVKLHVAMFHCRQNLFKCKFCEYHGYRKIDTRNHIMLKHKLDCSADDLETMIVRLEGKRQPLSDDDETMLEPVKQEPHQPPPVQQPADPTVMTEESFDEFASRMIMEIEGEPTAVPEPAPVEHEAPAPVLNGNYRPEPRAIDGYLDVEEALERVAALTQQQEEAKRAEEKRLLDEAIRKLIPAQPAIVLRQPSIDNALTKKRRRPKATEKTESPTTSKEPSPVVVDDKKKRRRRKKPIIDDTAGKEDEEEAGQSAPEYGDATSPRTRNTVRRPVVKIEGDEGDVTTVAKRPIRNRIKTVKEDFVYDLSQILKKEVEEQRSYAHLFPPFPNPLISVPARRQRALTTASPPPAEDPPMMTRRSRELAREAAMPFRKAPQALLVPVQNIRKYDLSSAVGAALKMAKSEASENLACFAKPPEIPKERPQIPAKISHFRRSDVGLVGWQALVRQSLSPEKPQRDAVKETRSPPKRSQRRASISSGFREIRRRRKAGHQKSPSPPPPVLQLATPYISGPHDEDDDDDMKNLIVPKPVFSSFLDELHARASKKVVPTPPGGRKRETTAQLGQHQEVTAAVPALAATPSTSGTSKRITLLQRLAENKSRKSLEGS